MLPKYQFGAWQDKTVPIFSVKSDWEPTEYVFPPLQKYFRHVLKDITNLYQQPTTNKGNLSQDEIKALRELNQMKDVIIKSADKGGSILKNTGTYNRRTITTKSLAETTNYCSETKQEFTWSAGTYKLQVHNQQPIRNTSVTMNNFEPPTRVLSLLITIQRDCHFFGLIYFDIGHFCTNR